MQLLTGWLDVIIIFGPATLPIPGPDVILDCLDIFLAADGGCQLCAGVGCFLLLFAGTERPAGSITDYLCFSSRQPPVFYSIHGFCARELRH
ncbi:MAG: hypothetical protein D3908_04530 [Candidatus Electrothrix sp. AUS4]|nr:hypothetical protein [Candidatus Electrothrix sp. AUS4]